MEWDCFRDGVAVRREERGECALRRRRTNRGKEPWSFAWLRLLFWRLFWEDGRSLKSSREMSWERMRSVRLRIPWQRRLREFWQTFSRCESGQATVESALLIPALLGVILLMIQPGIVLYDRIVMKDAAAQACRVLMTQGFGEDVDAFVRRRLGSVPQQDAFHVHTGSECSWDIAWSGGPGSATVQVTIGNEITPLPLIGFGTALFGALNEDGNLAFSVTVELPVQDSWALQTGAGTNPSAWIGAWLDES